MATRAAAFAAGIPLVNRDEGTPIPGGFVLQLTDKFSPADIVDRFRQRRMLGHRLHRQALDADRLVLTDQAGREFVGEITATVSNAGMNASHFLARLVSVPGATLLLGETALGLRQFLFSS